jgi:hypothetical protein
MKEEKSLIFTEEFIDEKHVALLERLDLQL